MKTIRTFIVLALVIGFALPAFAANTVDVTGNIQKNGFLTIDLDWTVQVNPATPRAERRKQVRDEMWNAILPKLVEKTYGYPVSFNECQFMIEQENVKLVKTLPNGNEVRNLKIKVRFNATPQSNANAVQTAKQMSKETYQEEFQKQLRPTFAKEF